MASDATSQPDRASGAPEELPSGADATGETLHTGRVFAVERFRYRDASGRDITKDVVRHPGAITVIPVDMDGRILMVEVGRLAVRRFLREFCAGKLEAGEDPAEAARRELEEETGRSAARIEPLGSYFTSPGFCDERMHAFVARDLTVVPQRLEPGEEIRVVSLSPEEIDRQIRSGEIDDGKSIAAWHLYRSKMVTEPSS